jgi:hypothetical protein
MTPEARGEAMATTAMRWSWSGRPRAWDEGRRPEVEGPIELYRPTEDGTEDLEEGANFDVEYHGEYASIEAAIDAIDCCGRWMISHPDAGHYTGHLNSVRGDIGVAIY